MLEELLWWNIVPCSFFSYLIEYCPLLLLLLPDRRMDPLQCAPINAWVVIYVWLIIPIRFIEFLEILIYSDCVFPFFFYLIFFLWIDLKIQGKIHLISNGNGISTSFCVKKLLILYCVWSITIYLCVIILYKYVCVL